MKKFNTIVIGVVVFVAVGSLISSIYLFVQYRKAQHIIKNTNAMTQIETKNLVEKVSKLIVLPENETPTIATVSDQKKLKDQPFFNKAENGDKLLIYGNAKTAILYSEKSNKIIAVGPIHLGETAPPIKVALYNGTNITGLTASVEAQLQSKLTNVVVTQKENAEKSYKKTYVIDIKGTQSKAAADLATFLGGEVRKLPEGETSPSDSDLLVIIGK